MDEELSFCHSCYEELEPRFVALSQRSEVMVIKCIDGKTVQTIEVLSDSIQVEYCSLNCWKAAEPEFIEVYNLTEIYPAFAWTAKCSSCGKPINRTQPYVTLNRYEMELQEQPWLTQGKMIDAREFAVLCNDCRPPSVHHIAEQVEETEDNLNLIDRLKVEQESAA